MLEFFSLLILSIQAFCTYTTPTSNESLQENMLHDDDGGGENDDATMYS